MGLTDASKAGVALFFGVVQFGIFEMVAEFVYPGYSVSSNYISDLGPPCSGGGTCPTQSSWIIFDTSVVILGLSALISAYFLYRYFRWKPITGLLALTGLGAVGVGVFNESAPFMLHTIFSLLTFLSIGLTALLSYRLQKPPLGYFSIILGLVSLVSLVLFVPDTGVTVGGILGIGVGGLERMIVYPVLFWSLAFSGHLMATSDTTKA
jgi:hypothetical membrane protein